MDSCNDAYFHLQLDHHNWAAKLSLQLILESSLLTCDDFIFVWFACLISSLCVQIFHMQQAVH